MPIVWEFVQPVKKRLTRAINFCLKIYRPLIKASYGLSKTGKCPYIKFSDIVIAETTCDGKKKMYELISEFKDIHIMHLPHVISEKSLEIWENEILRLKETLQNKFQTLITDKKLKENIKIFNEERKLMDEIQSFSKLIPPPITGLQLHKILYASSFIFDKKEQINDLNIIIEKIKDIIRNKKSPINKNAKRIIITGCPSGGIYEKTIALLEKAGGVVVAFENCVGNKNFNNLVDENEDPLKAIAKRYMNIACSVMSPNKNRELLIQKMVEEYKANGVIDIILQACHTYNIETISIKKVCNKASVPYMTLETDYSQNDTGQLKTRIEAFLEII